MATRRDLLDRVLDEELPRYAHALSRLGESSSSSSTHPDEDSGAESRPEPDHRDR
jgi:hypothetical protein